MNILVVGGSGFFGSRIAEALRSVGHEVTAGGRALIDLTRAATFAAADGYDVVVNASDAGRAPPDAIVERVLRRGGPIWVETTGETEVIERLVALRAVPDPRGLVLVGAGIFPGASNLLAALALARSGRSDVAIGVRVSPLSGAGRGMCGQMARMMVGGSSWIEGGRRVESAAALGATRVLPFPGGAAKALRVGLPETTMVHASTGARDVSMYLAPRPGALSPLFRVLGALVPKWGWARRIAATMFYGMFVAQRALLLRGVVAKTELTAMSGDVIVGLSTDDGVGAGAELVAAMVGALPARPAPGVKLPDEMFDAEAIFARVGAGIITPCIDAPPRALARASA